MTLAIVVTCAVAASAAEWKELKSPEGGFSVQFPGTPQKLKPQVEKATGKVTSSTWVLELDKGNTAYTAMFTDLPASLQLGDPQAGLTAGRDLAIKDQKGKLVFDRKIAIGSYPGREFAFTWNNAGEEATSHFQAVFVKRRLLQLVVVCHAASPVDEKDLRKFFDSFVLLKE
jgi:hypothetical protein